MIDKNELLKRISAIEQSEESVISIYSSHIQHVLRYSNINKESQAKIIEMLKQLDSDLEEHKIVTKQLVDAIAKSEKSLF
jgi:L-fucose isomerase-like protein